MGMRAIANIDGQKFYLQYGSPAFQLQHFGSWLTACRLTGATPSAENYTAHVEAFNLHGFTERVEADTYVEVGDLDWLYRVSIETGIDPETGGDTWTTHVSLAGPCLWQTHRGKMLAEVPAAWTVWADQDGTHDVARKIVALAKQAEPHALNDQQAQAWRDVAARWAEIA